MKSWEEIIGILAFIAIIYVVMELVVAHWAKIDKKKKKDYADKSSKREEGSEI